MTRYPYNFSNNVWGWFSVWIFVLAASYPISAGAVDASGRKPWNHYGPLPAKVINLQGDAPVRNLKIVSSAYLIERGSAVTGTDLCKEANSHSDNGTGVDTDHRLSNGDQYVLCSRDQSWNDHRSGSPSWNHATLEILPWWSLGNFLFGAILSIWPLSVVFRVKKTRRLQAKADHARKLANRKPYERAKAALGAAWARNEIDEATFESKLEELMYKYEQEN